MNMCQLVKNINGKSSAIAVSIHSKEDTYEVLEAIESFKGAVILNHIVEYFGGDTAKGLEDLVTHTNFNIKSLQASLKANTDRLNAINLAKRLKVEAEDKAKEAKARETEARAKLDKKLEAKAKAERLEAESKAKELSKAKKTLETVNETVILKGMSGATTEERLEVALVIPEGATVKEVKVITEKTKALNDMEETKRISVKELLAKYPTMSDWNLEAVFASKIGGIVGNSAHKEVVALVKPTTAEVAELRKSIMTKAHEANEEEAKTAERDELGCRVPTEDTEAYKARQTELAEELEADIKADEAKINDSIPLPTEKLNIPKGRMSKANAKEVYKALEAIGLSEDNLINYLKTMAIDLNLAKKLKAICK